MRLLVDNLKAQRQFEKLNGLPMCSHAPPDPAHEKECNYAVMDEALHFEYGKFVHNMVFGVDWTRDFINNLKNGI